MKAKEKQFDGSFDTKLHEKKYTHYVEFYATEEIDNSDIKVIIKTIY